MTAAEVAEKLAASALERVELRVRAQVPFTDDAGLVAEEWGGFHGFGFARTRCLD
jgi:hypothetical protein